jgi:hypothetical protein
LSDVIAPPFFFSLTALLELPFGFQGCAFSMLVATPFFLRRCSLGFVAARCFFWEKGNQHLTWSRRRRLNLETGTILSLDLLGS